MFSVGVGVGVGVCIAYMNPFNLQITWEPPPFNLPIHLVKTWCPNLFQSAAPRLSSAALDPPTSPEARVRRIHQDGQHPLGPQPEGKAAEVRDRVRPGEMGGSKR